ncbi:unnamed protein product, partial [Owenia fusiformis]
NRVFLRIHISKNRVFLRIHISKNCVFLGIHQSKCHVFLWTHKSKNCVFLRIHQLKRHVFLRIHKSRLHMFLRTHWSNHIVKIPQGKPRTLVPPGTQVPPGSSEVISTQISLDNCNTLKSAMVPDSNSKAKLDQILKTNEKVFTQKGLIKGYQVHLHVEKDATLIFHRPRPTPYALKPLIEHEMIESFGMNLE